MKTKILFFLLSANFLFSQSSESKVWDLLLKNNRSEARKLFSKTLENQKKTNIDVLLLDGFLSLEEGQSSFDNSFVDNFVNLSPDKAYLYPLMTTPMFLGKGEETGRDSYSLKKINTLANHKDYGNEPYVISAKATLDLYFGNTEDYKKSASKLKNIDKWQFCGVFENLNGSGIDIEYEPETYPKNDKLFDTNKNGKVTWYNQKSYQNLGYHFFYNEREYGQGIIYAQSFIDNPTERTVILETSALGDYKVFLNNSEVLSVSEADGKLGNASLVKLKLKAGINRILLKIGLNTDSYKSFSAQFFDEKLKPLEDLRYSDTYQDYSKNISQDTPSEVIPYHYETFFRDKIKNDPKNILNKILLLKGLLAVKKDEDAKILLDSLLATYPNSSLIKYIEIDYNEQTKQAEKNAEIIKNLEINDPGYYIVNIIKITDDNWIKSVEISELEKYRELTSKTKAEIFTNLYDFLLAARRSDITQMFINLEDVNRVSYNNDLYFSLFAPVYDTFNNSEKSTEKKLKEYLNNNYDLTIAIALYNNLIKNKKNEEAEVVIKKLISLYPDSNYIKSYYYQQLLNEQKYTEAIAIIDDAIANYPYSAQLYNSRAIANSNLKKTDLAISDLKKSLEFNFNNSKAITLLEDLTKKEDPITSVAYKDLYKLGNERKNKVKNETGVAILLDEYIVNVFPDGGYKKKMTYLYEILSEKGIEEMKEYNFGYQDNVLKSEILKPNGSIVPGERSGNTTVFSNLQIGDVLVIQSDEIVRNSGRFSRDFNLASYFNNYYPVVESKFIVITPKDKKFEIYNNNNTLKVTSKTVGESVINTWIAKDLLPIYSTENFAKPYGDITQSVTIASIKNWDEIAKWYSDLVKKVMVFDATTQKTFNEIFPQGATNLTEEQKAEKIYNFIENNIKYSSVDFRQSGYIPQKPSKTITSKLGDCKDVSTLFVVLGQKAGLDCNLVLVSTNNNPKNDLALPVLDFNHCIVKVRIDGKENFLELTDKYLPYKSFVKSLYGAKGLNIIPNSKVPNELFDITLDNNFKSKTEAYTEVSISDYKKEFKTTNKIYGEGKSYFNMFFNETSEEDKKSSMEEDLSRNLNKIFVVNSVKFLKNKDLTSQPLEFELNSFVNEKPKNVGSLKITEIPLTTKSYTKELIASENRKTDIKYITYENQEKYSEEVILNIPEKMKFVEVPENSEFNYKNHHYKLSFETLKPNQLKITKISDVSLEDIPASSYTEFKQFVEKVLDAENQIIGYK
ncbi:transglutaminase domain-containing protein [Epilithonimonas sp. UC225_85]|uniref:transglutaminase domain-containing protein n=1 Tax=Epilithonimonas sp. UC225_85 TaxID=3350167 RepID=UPI0036D4386E